jgi:divalent metal cation (Fe/Co/Zn/Cd) transporter
LAARDFAALPYGPVWDGAAAFRNLASSIGAIEAVELSHAPAAANAVATGEWLRLARLAKTLAWVSLGWLTIEGTVGVIAGVAAGSIALIAFGLDSAIEGLASLIVVWRFTGSRTLSEHAERRAQKLVAVSFFLLAPYIAVEALRTLIIEHHAETSIVGMALTSATLAICPGLGIAKQRIGNRLGSAATKGEGQQNLLCGGLAIGVLLGLLANTTLGIWWLDPAIGLVVASACVYAGRQTWRGESCSCAECVIVPARMSP